MKNSTYQKLSLFLFLVYATIYNSLAATMTFTNTGGDNLWSNASNWNSGTIPGSDDDAIISSGNLNIDLNIDVKSLTINNTSAVTFSHSGVATIGDLTLSGGSLNSTNKIVINSSFLWSGNADLTSGSTIELSATCTGTITGSGNRSLYANLVNYGTCTHSGGTLRFQVGGSIDNYGTYIVNGATFIINTGGGAFSNYGTFIKNGSSELSFFALLDQTASGTTNINAGILSLLAGGTHDGNAQISIANGAELKISSGTYIFGTNNSINGDGDFSILGGIISINGSYALNGALDISGGTVNFNSNNPAAIADLTLRGGIIQGSGAINISDAFSWQNTSTIQNTDTFKLESSCNTLIFSGGAKKLYSPMVNNGTISHSGGNLRFNPGSSFQNNGIYAANGPTKIFDDGGGSFDNNGTFDHQKNSNFNFNPVFNNNIDGIVKGQGNIDFSTINNLGTFSADAVYGTLELKGKYDNGSALNIGFDNSTHGALEAQNNVNLSGTLKVNIMGTVAPGSYTILSSTNGSVNGTFDSENLPGNFAVEYNTSTVNLLVGLLPVDLTKFEVRKQPRTILLEWQTATESNSKDFIIEHSVDGSNFSKIGEQAAAGWSDDTRNYRFIHKTPANGNNYYRLKQIDLDGSYEYSDLRAVLYYNFDKDISVYPNPTQGRIFVKNQSEKIFILKVIDANGKTVLVKNDLSPGAIALDLSHLPKAMYTLKIYADSFYSYEQKLMILE